MKTLSLGGQLFKSLISNGYNLLYNDCERINALNVFPVPDGDTGTNMCKTMEGGVLAINDSKVENLGLLTKEMARGMTFSARGNSGVILSQFFKGLALGLVNYEFVNTKEFASAMQNGVKQAYAVVKKPTEGTILTVMREASEKAFSSNVESFEEYFEVFLTEANMSLERTPELLPILKKAGVIDSGGAGFIKVFEGMALALDGKLLENVKIKVDATHNVNVNGFNANSILEFGYCTEFILQLQNSKVNPKTFELKIITDFLEEIGNSIVAFKDDDIVKVHVHTFEPGKVISFCQQFGEYVTFKMENMNVGHSESSFEEKEHKEIAIVSVASGDGICDLFTEMGTDVIVSGGQTMNPSIEDFINAFDKISAENIIVFPNNSNIIMAAKQAAANYSKSHVFVIETKSIAECYSALSMYDDTQEISEIIEAFNCAIENVITIETTYSIRDTEIDEFKINKGDFISFVNHKLCAVKECREDAVINALSSCREIEEKEVLTIIYGNDVSSEDVANLIDLINEKFDWLEVGSIEGNQEIYSYILSLE